VTVAGDRSGQPGQDADHSSADHAGDRQEDTKERIGVKSGGGNGPINENSYKTAQPAAGRTETLPVLQGLAQQEICFNCRQEGHSSSDCPEPEKCRRFKKEGHVKDTGQ
jgi:hypothetical protein